MLHLSVTSRTSPEYDVFAKDAMLEKAVESIYADCCSDLMLARPCLPCFKYCQKPEGLLTLEDHHMDVACACRLWLGEQQEMSANGTGGVPPGA